MVQEKKEKALIVFLAVSLSLKQSVWIRNCRGEHVQVFGSLCFFCVLVCLHGQAHMLEKANKLLAGNSSIEIGSKLNLTKYGCEEEGHVQWQQRRFCHFYLLDQSPLSNKIKQTEAKVSSFCLID